MFATVVFDKNDSLIACLTRCLALRFAAPDMKIPSIVLYLIMWALSEFIPAFDTFSRSYFPALI